MAAEKTTGSEGLKSATAGDAQHVIADDATGEIIHPESGPNNKEAGKTTVEEIEVKDAPIVNHFTALITGEQSLINNRITWMMTFQGFLFAAFAVAMSDQNDKTIRAILYQVLPLAGIFVAFFTAIGVAAAISSIANIKSQFKTSKYNHWPEPYSNRFVSFIGRAVALSFPVVIILTWSYVLYHYHQAVNQKTIPPTQIQNTNDTVKVKRDTVKL